ncbi:MAG: YncE family protein [Ktedonobacteraceae bacterium]
MRKILASSSILLLLMLLLEIYSPPPTHADGGAPNLAYVSGSTAGISVIDVGQSKVTKTLAISGDPHTILLSLDGRFLYVTQPALAQVSIIAANTGRTLCSTHVAGEPTLLALDQNSNTLYAAGNGAARVSAIDTTSCAIRHTFQTDSPVYGLAFGIVGEVGNILWVAGTNDVSIFNTQSAQRIGTIAIAGNPRYLTMPQGSEVAYVTTQQGSVDAIAFKTHQVYPLLDGGTFGPMDYDALTSEVYVPDAQHNVIDVLSPVNSSMTAPPNEPERVIPISAPPASIAITSDGLLGFVAMQGGKVAMLDLLDRSIVYTLNVGGNPHFIITGLYPPAGDISLPRSSAPPTTPASSGSPLNTIVIILFTIAGLALVLFIVLLIVLLRQRDSSGAKRG